MLWQCLAAVAFSCKALPTQLRYTLYEARDVEWIQKMNDAIAYTESHIQEKISIKDVAHIACCSVLRFQRMFAFVTDGTVPEYIRRRRMSMAADELCKSDIKVIDLSLKYGDVTIGLNIG